MNFIYDMDFTYVQVTKREISTDHLSNFSCPLSYCMTPILLRFWASLAVVGGTLIETKKDLPHI